VPVYEDLTPCAHRSADVEGELIAVGWLGSESEFATGEVPANFSETLNTLVTSRAVRRIRRWEACPFCDDEYPVRIKVGGRSAPVGDAEIRVVATDGIVYAAPTLIAHYVAAHGYCPPGPFVDAVMAEGDAIS